MEEFMLCVAYTVKSGYREDFIREVQQSGVLDVIRREDGCLTYEYYCSAAKEDQVLLIEKWATEKTAENPSEPAPYGAFEKDQK